MRPACPRTHRSLRRALVAALATAATLLAGAASAPAQGPLFGFGDSSALYPYEGAPGPERLARIEARAGAEVARFPVHWEAVEPLPPLLGGRPRYRWERFDRFVAALETRGIQPLPVLIGAPGWAREPLSLCLGSPCPPARWRLDNWARFAAAVARRYPRAAAIEVWNEPNHLGGWRTITGPNPGRYARLFEHAARAVRSVDPGLPVLIGSVGFTPSRDKRHHLDMTIGDFLSGFYNAVDPAVLRPVVGLGLHLYPGARELHELKPDGRFASTLNQVRGVRDAHDPHRQLWVTELGASTTLRREGGPVTEQEQSTAILNALAELEAASDVRGALVYTVVDRPEGTPPAEEGFGLVRRGPDFEPKLAYCELAAHWGEPAPPGCG